MTTISAETKKDSEAVAFIACVYKHVMGQSKSKLPWIRTNHALHAALRLAITANMKFDIDDFKTISSRFKGGYWMGAEHESFFSQAVNYNHLSACKAYEKWQNRGPFIFRDGKRMHVGKQFYWKPMEKHLTVTSFKEDGSALIACSYKTDRTIENRVTITPEMLKADCKHAENEKVVKEFCASNEDRTRVLLDLPSNPREWTTGHWQIAADRVREIIAERDAPDTSVTLTPEQEHVMLHALGLEKPLKKRARAYRNYCCCPGGVPAEECQLLIESGCAGHRCDGVCFVTPKGIRVLGAHKNVPADYLERDGIR